MRGSWKSLVFEIKDHALELLKPKREIKKVLGLYIYILIVTFLGLDIWESCSSVGFLGILCGTVGVLTRGHLRNVKLRVYVIGPTDCFLPLALVCFFFEDIYIYIYVTEMA